GTTSPTSGYKLDVDGSAIVQGICAATQTFEGDTLRSFRSNTPLILEGNGAGVIRLEDNTTCTGNLSVEGALYAESALITESRVANNYRYIEGDIGISAEYPATSDHILIFDNLTISRTADLVDGSSDGQILEISNMDDTYTIGFDGNVDSGTYNLLPGTWAKAIWIHPEKRWFVFEKGLN
ncbi:MAG: hypothetical protein PHQ69_11060, partial [Bacteroidales bacterium]|nr:hypothetical protein [Bacteroidales bacterium]